MKIISFGHDPDANILPNKKRDLISFGYGSDTALIHVAGHGVGMDTPQESQDKLETAAKKAAVTLDAKQKIVEAEFERPMSAARLFEITDNAWKTTTQQWNLIKGLSDNYQNLKTETQKAVVTLLEMRARARILRDKISSVPPAMRSEWQTALMPGTPLSNEYKHYVTFPYWGSKLAIDAAVANRGNIIAIVNIPSGVITYVADQAGRGIAGIAKGAGEGLKGIPPAFGLPGWFLPTAVAAAILAILGIAVSKAKGVIDVIPEGHPAK